MTWFRLSRCSCRPHSPSGSCSVPLGTCAAKSGSSRTPAAASVGAVLALLLLLAGCTATPGGEEVVVAGEGGEASCEGTVGADFPEVVGATVERVGEDGFRVSATVCSAYDTAERYADAWRVRTPGGDVLGVRELLHDHAGEQPFTRSLGRTIEIPDGVDTVVVEGRDLANGWGGGTIEVAVPR